MMISRNQFKSHPHKQNQRKYQIELQNESWHPKTSERLEIL